VREVIVGYRLGAVIQFSFAIERSRNVVISRCGADRSFAETVRITETVNQIAEPLLSPLPSAIHRLQAFGRQSASDKKSLAK
jgi:hypothetical protein